MSTILKALKKAQQERELLEVPKLDARMPPARPRRALWPWLIGGALLTNAAVLALVFWLSGAPTPVTTVADSGERPASAPQAAQARGPEVQPETAAGAAPAPAANADPAPAPARTAAAAAGAPEELAPDLGATAEDPTPRPEATAEAALDASSQTPPPRTAAPDAPPTPQWDSTASGAPAEAPADVEDKAKSAAAGERAAVTPAALALTEDTGPADGESPVAVLEAPAAASPAPADIPPAKPLERLAALSTPEQAAVPRPSETTTAPERANGALSEVESEVEVAALPKHAVPDQPPEPAPEAAADPYSALPVLRQLPRDMRRALPELAISIHVYDRDPRWRFVRINKTKYQEGDRLAKDLTLEAITPGGLVLDYQGTRFQLAKP